MTLEPNKFMVDILQALQKMHKVLSSVMETRQLEQLFKEALRQLLVQVEAFFSQISTESKFAKARVKVDLQQIQNVIEKLAFERQQEVTEMTLQRIKSLLNAKAGGLQQQAEPGEAALAESAEEAKQD